MRGVLFLLAVAFGLTIYLSFGVPVMNEVTPVTENSTAVNDSPTNITKTHDRLDAIMFKWVPVSFFGAGLIVAAVSVLRRRRRAGFR
jgi:hypothetical protein